MVDKKLMLHLAELSKLVFGDEELEKMTRDMKNIVELMDRVKEIDSGLIPYSQEPRDYSSRREDEPTASYERDDILKNAGKVIKSSFAVPKVM